MFSPYYARARRFGATDPMDHCALNVVLRDPRGNRWAMTERRRREVSRSHTTLALGASSLCWRNGVLEVSLDELGYPLPFRVRGRVRFTPRALSGIRIDLAPGGLHSWSPIAPCGSVEVELDEPRTRWRGHAYLDSNFGQRPLERDFAGWHWSRSLLEDGVAVLYDVEPREGDPLVLALAFDDRGRVREIARPPLLPLPSSRWGIARLSRSEPLPGAPRVKTLLDAPFYARSVVTTRLLDQPCPTVHESLNLDRFRNPIVQWMLTYRVPRSSSLALRSWRRLRS